MLSYHWEVRHTAATVAAIVCLAMSAHHSESSATVDANPLPSWRNGATRSALVTFVTGAVNPASPGYIAPDERIAVFDMDGTLIPDKPVPGALLAISHDLQRAIANHPTLAGNAAVAAFLRGDIEGLARLDESERADLVAAAIDGRTADTVADDMRREQRALLNARYQKPYTQLAYRPMTELLRYLEANGFRTWICSGSPVAYTRGLSQEVFGIPPERVIGSHLETRFQDADGKSGLIYTGSVGHVTDRAGKPPVIELAIGRRPVFVAGNVGGAGDIAMMRYSADRHGPSFALLINHDDADREFAYGETKGASLAAAARYRFHVASIKNDWANVFP